MTRRKFLFFLTLIPISSIAKVRLIESSSITYKKEESLSSFLKRKENYIRIGKKKKSVNIKKQYNIIKISKKNKIKHESTKLNLYSVNTNEWFKESLTHKDELNFFLRDFRENEIIDMDSNILKMLAKIQKEVGYNKPLNILSGYRTKKTNKKLRKRNRNVAKNSLHMKGQAIDISSEHIKLSKLKRIAKKHQIGGLGYYPRNGFIHIDSGKFRSWKS
jgi:uncharacterized protein YcbK (DUF882 family)